MGGNRPNCRVQQGGAEGEPGDVFQNVGMLDGFGRRLSPRKGCVSCDENSRDGYRVEALRAKAADYDSTSVADVPGGDFFGGECFRDGNRTVKIVSMGGSEAGNWLAGLSPRSRELGVGVDDSANLGELAVEQGVRVEIAGGA